MAYNQPPNPGYYQPQGQNPYPQAPGWNASMGGGQYAQPNYGQPGENPHYAEGGVPKNEMSFSDQTIRAAFIRKVFTMVTLMLGVVAVMSAVPLFHTPTMQMVQKAPGLVFLGYAVFLVVYIALICCESVRRSFPANIICTAILTLAIGFMTMMITAQYQIESVFLCLAITTLCCGGIILFASQTKYDITSCMGVIAIASLLLMMFSLVTMVFAFAFPKQFHFMRIALAGAMAILFMAYLAIDIQMIMGGRKYEISPEDYIYASVQLFLDIVQIFWLLLSLFGDHN